MECGGSPFSKITWRCILCFIFSFSWRKMSESKRKSEGGDSNRKKKKYRSVRTLLHLYDNLILMVFNQGWNSCLGQEARRWPWGLGELCVSIPHRKISFNLLSIGIKGKEKQTIGEVYELFESVCHHFHVGMSTPFYGISTGRVRNLAKGRCWGGCIRRWGGCRA